MMTGAYPTILVVGLGKLGSPLAITLAYKGFKVIGLDIDQELVEALNKGVAHIRETNIQTILNEAKERLAALPLPA